MRDPRGRRETAARRAEYPVRQQSMGGTPPEAHMSKGMDKRKETKKKPLKTPEEKRALKREKKAQRGLTSL